MSVEELKTRYPDNFNGWRYRVEQDQSVSAVNPEGQAVTFSDWQSFWRIAAEGYSSPQRKGQSFVYNGLLSLFPFDFVVGGDARRRWKSLGTKRRRWIVVGGIGVFLVLIGIKVPLGSLPKAASGVSDRLNSQPLSMSSETDEVKEACSYAVSRRGIYDVIWFKEEFLDKVGDNVMPSSVDVYFLRLTGRITRKNCQSSSCLTMVYALYCLYERESKTAKFYGMDEMGHYFGR